MTNHQHDSVTPYESSDLNKKKQVEQMFDNISPKYDLLNRVLSMGIDIQWRKDVIKMVKASNPQTILDIATGTGDLAIMMGKNTNAKITGLDLSNGMLEVGRKKVKEAGLENRIEMVQGDSENLPFPDNTFDSATVSFGVRNFENLEKGLTDILRTLKPGGQLIILETSVPTQFPFKQGYYVYTNFIMPTIGKLFSKDKKAYQYLSTSAQNFPFGEVLNNILRKIGFIDVKHLPQTFGVATIYQASKK